jgi:hypothetical protein
MESEVSVLGYATFTYNTGCFRSSLLVLKIAYFGEENRLLPYFGMYRRRRVRNQESRNNTLLQVID